MLTIYRDKHHNFGCEYYKGENYISGSLSRSYSINYSKFIGLPKKYEKVVRDLEHELISVLKKDGIR